MTNEKTHHLHNCYYEPYNCKVDYGLKIEVDYKWQQYLSFGSLKPLCADANCQILSLTNTQLFTSAFVSARPAEEG